MAAQTSPLPARCLAEARRHIPARLLRLRRRPRRILTGNLAGLWQVAVVWAVAIMVATYVVGGVSGAHINPAITLALAVWGRFAWRDVVFYAAFQFVGAFAAAAMLFFLFGSFLAEKEAVQARRPGPAGE